MAARLIIWTFDEAPRWPVLFGRTFSLLADDAEIMHVDPTDGLPANGPRPDVVVVSREWTPAWRVGLAELQRQGVPIVYVMDGVIEWSYIWNNQSYIRPEGTFQQPLLADHLCVLGRQPARYLASLGHGDRVRIVGLPRLEERVAAARRATPAGDVPRVLISTARTFGHNVEQKVMVRRALRDLAAWFAGHPEIAPEWRVAGDVAAEAGLEPMMDGTYDEALARCTACISFPSTGLLEAMRTGVPTAQVDYRPVPLLVGTAWAIRSAEHIASVVPELLNPPAEKLAFQSYCLGEELAEGDGSVRLANLLRAVARREPVPVETTAPAPGTFGPLDYRLVHSEISAFSAAPLSLVQAELDATYRTLDATRRTVEQLRNELGWAREEMQKRGQRCWELEQKLAQQNTKLSEVWQRHAEHVAQIAEHWRIRGAQGAELDRLHREEAAFSDYAQGHPDFAALVHRLRDPLQLWRFDVLVARLQQQGVKSLAVCGAGAIGARLCRLLQDGGVSVTCVTDRDRSKWNTRLEGAPVCGLDEAVRSGVTTFVVGSLGSIDAIRADIQGRFDNASGPPVIFSL